LTIASASTTHRVNNDRVTEMKLLLKHEQKCFTILRNLGSVEANSNQITREIAIEAGMGKDTKTPEATLRSQIFHGKAKNLFVLNRNVTPHTFRLKPWVVEYLNRKLTTNALNDEGQTDSEKFERPSADVTPSIVCRDTTDPTLAKITKIIDNIARSHEDVTTLRELLKNYPSQKPVLYNELVLQRKNLELMIKDAGFKLPKTNEYETEFRLRSKMGGDKLPHCVWYLPQICAAMEVFCSLYIKDKKWVNVDANIQSGKTGVMSYLIAICHVNGNLCVDDVDFVPPDNDAIFALTAMSDTDALKQTQTRLGRIAVPDTNILHLPHITHGHKRLKAILEKATSKESVLIIDDESHIGTKDKQKKNTNLYKPIQDAGNPNVRVVTFSATDCVKSSTNDAAQVTLHIVDGYTSLMDKLKNDTVYSIEAFGSLISKEHIDKLFDFCDIQRDRMCNNEPTYDIIRPPPKSYDMVVEAAHRKYGSDHVVEINSKADERQELVKNISSAPSKSTCVILKNMLSVSTTVSDEHTNLWFERDTSSCYTAFQRLRLLGYHKQKRVTLIVSNELIKHYLSIWACGASGVARSLAVNATSREVTRATGSTLTVKSGILATETKQRGPTSDRPPSLTADIANLCEITAVERENKNREMWDFFGMDIECRCPEEVIKLFEDRYPNRMNKPTEPIRTPNKDGKYKGFITESVKGKTAVEQILSQEGFRADPYGKGRANSNGGRWRIYYMDIRDPTTIRYAYVAPKPVMAEEAAEAAAAAATGAA